MSPNSVLLYKIFEVYEVIVVEKMVKVCDTFLCPCVIVKRGAVELEVWVVRNRSVFTRC